MHTVGSTCCHLHNFYMHHTALYKPLFGRRHTRQNRPLRTECLLGATGNIAAAEFEDGAQQEEHTKVEYNDSDIDDRENVAQL